MGGTSDREAVRFEVSDGSVVYTYPSDYYDPRKVHQCIDQMSGQLSCRLSEDADGLSTLEISTTTAGRVELLTTELFCRINGYPHFASGEGDTFTNSDQPVLSCIILLTANEQFALKHLIPSIIHNTRDCAMEIILVYNGAGANLDDFRVFRICTSEFAAVARGYNAGAREARGEYLAIFHDDCVVNDSCWASKCIRLLARDAVVVSPEVLQVHVGPFSDAFIIAKNVPLVIRRDDYWRVGGYDESYYAGWEDLDFTYKVLSQHEAVRQVNMEYLHFNGMSTIILLGTNPSLYRRLFDNNVLPQRVVRALRKECLAKLRASPSIRLISSRSLSYFAEKFDTYLKAHSEGTMFKEYHRSIVAEDPHNPVLHDKASLIALYKTTMNSEYFPKQ